MISIIISAAMTAAAPSAASANQTQSYRTAKSADDFAACFMDAQERQSRAFWIVPHDDGLRISNAGASGGGAAYSLRYSQAGSGGTLSITFDGLGEPKEELLLDLVRACS